MARRRWGPNKEPRRRAWTAEEDMILTKYVKNNGQTDWGSLAYKAGLNRCAKGCRLRWRNHIRPDIRRDNISSDEEELIIRMHRLLGNRWSLIAGRLPGRTDNQIKNHWHTHIGKKLRIPVSISESSTSKHRSTQLEDNASPSIIRPVPYKPLSSSSILDVTEFIEEPDYFISMTPIL